MFDSVRTKYLSKNHDRVTVTRTWQNKRLNEWKIAQRVSLETLYISQPCSAKQTTLDLRGLWTKSPITIYQKRFHMESKAAHTHCAEVEVKRSKKP